jgi:outer membrane protein TolC
MVRDVVHVLPSWKCLRRLTVSMCVCAPLLLSGCMQFQHSAALTRYRQAHLRQGQETRAEREEPHAERGGSNTAQPAQPANQRLKPVAAGHADGTSAKPSVQQAVWQTNDPSPGQGVTPIPTQDPSNVPTLRPVANGVISAAGRMAQPARAPVTQLPASEPVASTPPIPIPEHPAEPEKPTVLPVSLDTVFHLAEEQNLQIGMVREKLRQAYAEKNLAAARWLPDLWVGTAYYRHEGGIQDFPGELIRSSTGAQFAGMEMNSQFDIRQYAYERINAQRAVWQQKGELVKVTTDTTLEAASTYIDLLTARHGEAIAHEMEKDLSALLKRAEKLASTEPAARVEVSRIRSELMGQQAVLAKLHQQAEAAAAKLAYLLGVDPCCELIPIDAKLIPLELVDAGPATCELVAQALQNGPGVQEMEGLLGLINDAMERARGVARFMPVFGVRMAEGGFGAGPDATMNWDNRFDLGLQARWNLTEYLTARNRRMVALSQMQQAQLAYQDLRLKLTSGVHATRAEIHGNREQIRLGQKQIDDARIAQKLSFDRLNNNLPGSSHSEVLMAIRTVGLAQVNYLTAVNAYDKAQIRLMLLLGANAPACRTVTWQD